MYMHLQIVVKYICTYSVHVHVHEWCIWHCRHFVLSVCGRVQGTWKKLLRRANQANGGTCIYVNVCVCFSIFSSGLLPPYKFPCPPMKSTNYTCSLLWPLSFLAGAPPLPWPYMCRFHTGFFWGGGEVCEALHICACISETLCFGTMCSMEWHVSQARVTKWGQRFGHDSYMYVVVCV